MKEIEGARVKTIQFIDRNTIHGTQVRTSAVQVNAANIDVLSGIQVTSLSDRRPILLTNIINVTCDLSFILYTTTNDFI